MTSNLSDDQIESLKGQRKVANDILEKCNTVKTTDPVIDAIEMIARRIIASGNSLAVLLKHAPHDYEFDAASILRTIYDVMLQGLYIMANSAKQDERAKLYLDFMHIERKRRIELLDASGTDFAKRINSNSKRAGAEPEIKKQFDTVKAKYLTKRSKLRDTWYPGDLCVLAKASKLEPEYKLMQKFLSGVIHSSPLTLKEGPFARDFWLMDLYWQFAFRIIGAYAEYKKVALNQTEQDIIDSARQNVFNLP